jgi:AcrR family transcriptional regulator
MPLMERRAQLVDAALTVAADEGIGAATVRRVAEEAGVALGVVHYCFEDKNELFGALAARIVDDLTGAGSAALDLDDAPSLEDALQAAIAGLWDTIERSPGEQLLTYEITTHALRHRAQHGVALRQYDVSQTAAEHMLSMAANVSRATWTRPVADLAGEALAVVDGVTLRWLVDGDGVAARARLASFAGYLATQAKSRRRPRKASAR